ncbi:MAG: FAD-dependent oxidoreductase [Victivallales bacterium]|nr:FAD-dependent oxidoreductase [Victivallales bacterium]
MQTTPVEFTVHATDLGVIDVLVVGGGIAGCFAAATAARQGASVLLVEGMGCLGGTLTHGLVPQVLDRTDKGGMIQELYNFLDSNGLSCPRAGKCTDENGKLLPGNITSVEGAKVFFDRLCMDAGVRIMLYSHVIDVNVTERNITQVLIGSECGAYTVKAKIFIDATGNGTLSRMAGCQGEIGHPTTGMPQPASMTAEITGITRETSVYGADEKDAYGRMLADHGIAISGTQSGVVRMPDLQNWLFSVNFEYGVNPADIFSLTQATIHGRGECLDSTLKHRTIPGYENVSITAGTERLGIREGLRIQGNYRLTVDDILNGARFDDAICMVYFNVDIHKLHNEDTTSTSRGFRSKPYHIPFRCLVPSEIDNMLLCGRLISGDFFAHASYRVMGPMGATGEAAGFAAAFCVSHAISPQKFDGKLARDYMKSQGYGGI